MPFRHCPPSKPVGWGSTRYPSIRQPVLQTWRQVTGPKSYPHTINYIPTTNMTEQEEHSPVQSYNDHSVIKGHLQ